MVNSTVDISDYLAILRRRRVQIIVPSALILLISISLAFGLPPVYQSRATILIEQQEIPQELVQSTVTGYASERLQVISKRVMIRANLWRIIEEYDLFPEERHVTDRGSLISRVRDNIQVKMVSADVIDPRSGRDGRATIAFDVTFESDNPEAAQKVTNELVSLFLKENIRSRTQKAEITSDFLAEEAKKLGEEITRHEAALAAFKRKNSGRLPEQMQLNMGLMERTGRELEEVERQLYTLEERNMSLESQLAQTEPYTVASPKGRLRELMAKYLQASAVYSPDHPDVVTMRREIEALIKQVGGNVGTANVSGLESQLVIVRADLAAAREKYSEDHPDIIRLKKSLAAINEALQNASSESMEMGDISFPPDNPAYNSVMMQLELVKIRLKAESEKRERLREKLAIYEKRVLETPRVEQKWLFMRRDYDGAVKKYYEIKQKQLQAKISEQLEQESKGERFSLLDPPNLPSQPIRPNRMGILLLGTVLSMAGGLSFAAVKEFMDRTIRGAKAVTSLLTVPPLSIIPYIENRKDVRRARNIRLLAIALGLLVLLLIVLLAYFFWIPDDTVVGGM
jgi:succinoglycan biosynthesis transport protein ExoP